MNTTTDPLTEVFAQDVTNGLARSAKQLPCKWLYDQRGSELFEEITQLEEYYPTRTERKILETHASDIAKRLGPGTTLVEYGAGSAVKTRILLNALVKPDKYIPIDISADFLEESARILQKEFPKITVEPVTANFLSPIELPISASNGKVGGFFPGSTIGNLSDEEIIQFLTKAREELNGDARFIFGVDLKKDPDVLIAAYNDAQGVTAAFNRNILVRINRELKSNIEVENFQHQARWDESKSRIEMHLVSESRQTLEICGQRFEFEEGESIHTENSRKFEIDDLRTLAKQCGWSLVDNWLDDRNFFAVLMLQT